MNEKPQKLFLDKLDLRNNVFEGIVANSNDPYKKSRIQVYIPNLTSPPTMVSDDGEKVNQLLAHIPPDGLPWYEVVSSPSSHSNAVKSVPVEGSRVLVIFPDDDIYNGLVIGIISSKPAPSEAVKGS